MISNCTHSANKSSKIFIILILVIIFSNVTKGNAQIDTITPVKRSHINNIIKINVAGLFIGRVCLQDEVYFNGRISGALGFNFGIPSLFFPKYIFSNSDVEAKSMTVSGMSITPEIRFYTANKAPKGFYLAPYFRYSNYKIKGIEVSYTSDDTLRHVVLDGKYSASEIGLMIGSQSKSGSHFVLDWWIAGIAVPGGKFTFDAPGKFKQSEIDDFTDKATSLQSSIKTTGSTTKNLHIEYKPSVSVRLGFAIGYIF